MIRKVSGIEWTILTIGLIIFIFAIWYTYIQHSAPTLKDVKLAPYYGTKDDMLKDIENGDLVFMAGRSKGEKTCAWFLKSPFTHVGLLFWERHPSTSENILYIFDCDLGQKSKEGVRVMNFEDKLKQYRGEDVIAIKKLNVPAYASRPSTQNFVDEIGKFINIDFDNKMLTWYFSNLGTISYIFKNKNKMFCSELVAEVYQNLSIMKKNKKAYSYNPGDFFRGDVSMQLGYSLSNPTFFKFR